MKWIKFHDVASSMLMQAIGSLSEGEILNVDVDFGTSSTLISDISYLAIS